MRGSSIYIYIYIYKREHPGPPKTEAGKLLSEGAPGFEEIEKTLENVRFGAFLGPPIIGVPGAITAKLGGWFWGRFPGRFSVFFCFSEDVFWRSFGG